ncbi:hypothetical protein, partial [Pseudomonas psychrophila]|uniref:hypothetical protein n=1 Tax=Pseudomonas psychrophila TaxID=122355 RepID=UPI0005266976
TTDLEVGGVYGALTDLLALASPIAYSSPCLNRLSGVQKYPPARRKRLDVNGRKDIQILIAV